MTVTTSYLTKTAVKQLLNCEGAINTYLFCYQWLRGVVSIKTCCSIFKTTNAAPLLGLLVLIFSSCSVSQPPKIQLQSVSINSPFYFASQGGVSNETLWKGPVVATLQGQCTRSFAKVRSDLCLASKSGSHPSIGFSGIHSVCSTSDSIVVAAVCPGFLCKHTMW